MKSLTKTSDKEIPHEFKEWVSFVQTYEQQNPGKFYLAAKYGQAIDGVKSKDLMSSTDYKKIFGENGELPVQLQKAYAAYSDRLLSEAGDRSPKISTLMSYLNKNKSTKKAMNKTEVDQIVQLIKDLDQDAESFDIESVSRVNEDNSAQRM